MADVILPPADRLQLARRHGVDIEQLEELVVADYPEGRVILLRGSFIARVVVAEIAHRMAPLESRADTPIARVAGFYGLHRIELLALGEHTLAVLLGTPALAGALAQRRSARRDVYAQPIVVIHRGMFDLPPAGIGLVLAGVEETVVQAAPTPEGDVAIHAVLRGRFPPGVEANLASFVQSLAQSDLGRALGLDEAAHSMQIRAEGPADERATVRVDLTWPSAPLARGLSILLDADVARLLAIDPGSSTRPPAQPSAAPRE